MLKLITQSKTYFCPSQENFKKTLNNPVETWSKAVTSTEHVQALSAFPVVEMMEAKKLSRSARSLVGTILALSIPSGSVMQQQGTLGKTIARDKRRVSGIIKGLKDKWFNNGYKEGMDYETRYFSVTSGRNKVKANIYSGSKVYLSDPMLSEVRDLFLESAPINLLKLILTKCRTYYKKVILRIVNMYNTHIKDTLIFRRGVPPKKNPPMCELPNAFLLKKEEKAFICEHTHNHDTIQDTVLNKRDNNYLAYSTLLEGRPHSTRPSPNNPVSALSHQDKNLKRVVPAQEPRAQVPRLTSERKQTILKKLGLLDPEMIKAFVRCPRH